MGRLVVSLALAAVAAALTAQAAFGCSCAGGTDPREDLDNADAALYGEVVARTADDRRATYRLRVEEAFKGDLGPEVEVVTAADGASCGLEAKIGDRIGLLLYRDRAGRWTSGLCSQRTRKQLRAGHRGSPVPSSRGPVRIVVGAQFGPDRTAGLDARGRLARVGDGSGEVEALSACPGARTVLELVRARDGTYAVAARDVASFGVRRATALRLPSRRDAPTDVRCLSPGGARAIVAVVGSRSSRLLGLRRGEQDTVWKGGGERVVLGRRHAWVQRERPLRVAYASGTVSILPRIAGLKALLAISPRDRLLVAHAITGRSRALLLLDARTGRVRARRAVRYAHAAFWPSAGRLVFAAGARLVFADRRLRAGRSVREGWPVAARGGRVLVVRDGRLRAYDRAGLPLGRARRLFTRAVRALALLPARARRASRVPAPACAGSSDPAAQPSVRSIQKSRRPFSSASSTTRYPSAS